MIKDKAKMANSITLTAEVFFVDVVTGVFDSYFQQLGARREPSRNCSVVRYSTGSWFAEILYLPSDGPNYLPRVEIGCLPERFVDPRRNRVDVMHTTPNGTEEHDYNLRWRYRSSHDLKIVLPAIRDRILTVFTLPILQDAKGLQALLDHRFKTIEAEWEEETNNHNDSIARAEANRAFKLKDYAKAIQHYDRIPQLRRTRIDESKLRIAKRRLSPEPEE